MCLAYWFKGVSAYVGPHCGKGFKTVWLQVTSSLFCCLLLFRVGTVAQELSTPSAQAPVPCDEQNR